MTVGEPTSTTTGASVRITITYGSGFPIDALALTENGRWLIDDLVKQRPNGSMSIYAEPTKGQVAC